MYRIAIGQRGYDFWNSNGPHRRRRVVPSTDHKASSCGPTNVILDNVEAIANDLVAGAVVVLGDQSIRIRRPPIAGSPI